MSRTERKVRNLVGERFGNLTVVELLPERTSYGARVYRCLCDCGNYRDVISQTLTSGESTHCKSCPLVPDARRMQKGQKRGENAKPYPITDEFLINRRKQRKELMARNQTGKRYGRLVVLKPLEKIINKKRYVLCRCDCGKPAILPMGSIRSGNTKSCGCLMRGSKPLRARCPSCGNPFEINIDGTPTPQFCPNCAPKYSGRNWRVCPICNKLFQTPPSSTTNTCSPACSSTWNSMLHSGVDPARTWSSETKEAAEDTRLRVVRSSPLTGRFETNKRAKIWTLIDPTGQEHEVRNLMMWCRENATLFGKEPGDKSANQILSGFLAIAQTLRGTRKSGVHTYKGWSLKEPPRDPTDSTGDHRCEAQEA